jgi:ABC-type bacteriocin/lantibiotic exporter with double-glycine peptidase domain
MSCPKLEMALTGKRFNYIAKNQAKLQDTLDEFQTIRLMNCLKQWHDQWAQRTKR